MLSPKCLLVDWDDSDGVVGEGRIISTDPCEMVNDSPLGPTDVKVLVEIAKKPEAFLWRPASKIHTMEEAVGQMIAWPTSKCVKLGHGLEPEEIAPMGSVTNSLNKCKLLDLSDDNVVVAEGRWQTTEPKALINGLPLGPKAVKIFLDVVHEPELFRWRPTFEVSHLSDCLHSFVAWPYKKVEFENPPNGTEQPPTSEKSAATKTPAGLKTKAKKFSRSSGKPKAISPTKKTPATVPTTSPNSPTDKSPETAPMQGGNQAITENKKCKLMDISGKKQVVAEGSVHSTDPDQMVHCVRLGPNAARVWVNAVLVPDAAVWRRSDEIESMKDAHGSSIAWPMDKLVIY